VERGGFLTLLAAAVLAGIAPDERPIPAELRGGRFFAVPRTRDGKVFACWLDTDGHGFIFEDAVARLHLPTRGTGSHVAASLPPFAPGASVPPLSRGSDLPVFVRDADDRADPILRGFDAQLGGSWFADRTWELNFARGSVRMRSRALAAGAANVPVHLDGGVYPRVTVIAGNEALPMSFDIAASVALAQAGGERVTVEATSFVSRALLSRWETDHPDWRVERNVSSTPGIDRITVPEIHAGSVLLRAVRFTTRPGDDVFQGTGVVAKLGANAYANRTVTIDYRNARLRIEAA
jgi:hypothetical protein